MEYNKGNLLRQSETGIVFEVRMIDKDGLMMLLGTNGELYEVDSVDPEGFEYYNDKEEQQAADEFMNNLIKEDIGINEISLELYVRHLELHKMDVNKAIISTRAVLVGVFNERHLLDV